MIKGEGNRKRKCKECETKIPACEGLICGVNFVCSIKCAYKLGNKALRKSRERQSKKAKREHQVREKEATARLRERKKELRPIKWWQDKLQRVVNYYVVHIRDADKPCCTCGTDSPSIKYDAGHYRTRAAAPELRYELTNIHKQCAINCNVYGSGMRTEYRGFIIHHYGLEHLDWLDGKHDSLKEQFETWKDYEREIDRYNKIIKSHGHKPVS